MTDVVVIGGGIAGVSAAAHLAPHCSVTLLEMEPTLAFHTTGRSAALFVLNYGAEGTRPLTHASKEFLENPPEGSTDSPLLTDRGFLWVATPAQMPRLEMIAEEDRKSGADSLLLDPEATLRQVPVLREEVIAGGLLERSARDIDVAGLHQAFVRIARRHNAEIQTNSAVTSIKRNGRGWTIAASDKTIKCQAIVNAAGAWGDKVAEMAGVEPVGLTPMRRTAFMVPGNDAYSKWPMVADTDQGFYFKADGSQILCSLSEEEPAQPGDPRPRMEDVALAIERINETTTLGIRSVSSQWTGLRTFSPDRELVIGEDPQVPGFFWLVGQGGTGIQTSPAYGALVSAQVRGSDHPDHLAAANVDPAATHPARFRP